MKWMLLSAALLLAGAGLTVPTLVGGSLVVPHVTLADVLAGKAAPLSVPLQALDATWMRFELGGMDASELFLFIVSQGRLDVAATFYSRGHTLTLAGETYLVAYRREKPSLDLGAMMRGQGAAPPIGPLTAETPLQLSLLNVHNLGGLLGMRPFVLETELAAQQTLQPAPLQGNWGGRETNMANIRQLMIHIMVYTHIHDEKMPPMETVQALQEAIEAPQVAWKNPRPGMAYAVNTRLSGKPVGDIERPEETVVLFDDAAWPDGTRAVGFLDGHVEQVDEARWQELRKQLGPAQEEERP